MLSNKHLKMKLLIYLGWTMNHERGPLKRWIERILSSWKWFQIQKCTFFQATKRHQNSPRWRFLYLCIFINIFCASVFLIINSHKSNRFFFEKGFLGSALIKLPFVTLLEHLWLHFAVTLLSYGSNLWMHLVCSDGKNFVIGWFDEG